MIVRGVDFGHVLNSSGARGFFGEGYWFHRCVPGLNYRGSTFVAKTTTLEERAGNMPLGPRWRPRELVPKCIVVKPFKGVTLNSVGLSGPGIRPLLHAWNWNDPGRPWMISLMSVRDTPEGRAEEISRMSEVIDEFKLPSYVGVQLNLSCPNVGLDPAALVEDAAAQVDSLSLLGRPLFLKVNALFPVASAVSLSHFSAVDGFIVSNTIPWGKLRGDIDWKGLFGSEVSPLAHIGGGGLSGRPLLPLVTEWVRSARELGFRKAIVGGGGILSVSDAAQMIVSGVDAIELGSVSILRPWRVASIIKYANATIPLRRPVLRLAGAA
jgi:dihydroorotate dehydrogenase